jgi:integrase
LPDSKTGPKTVYLNAPARAVMATLPRPPRTPLVFQAPGGFEPVQMWEFWNELRGSCGLDDVRLHDLRHSFASVAITNGVPLLTIGRLLGHELPETTVRYAHLADDFVADAAVRVSGSLARCLEGGK